LRTWERATRSQADPLLGPLGKSEEEATPEIPSRVGWRWVTPTLHPDATSTRQRRGPQAQAAKGRTIHSDLEQIMERSDPTTFPDRERIERAVLKLLG
jgi:hypothetical protein